PYLWNLADESASDCTTGPTQDQMRNLSNERCHRRSRAATHRFALLCTKVLSCYIAGNTLFAELACRRYCPPADAGASRRGLAASDQPAAALPEIDLRFGRLCGVAARPRSEPPHNRCELLQRVCRRAASPVPHGD